MAIAAEKTIRELALEFPAATRIFEQLGIDYCCCGHQTLEVACIRAGVPVARVEESLTSTEPTERERSWHTEPLFGLIEHIKTMHHRYTRDEIKRLGPLFEKVWGAGSGAGHAYDERGSGVIPVYRAHGGSRHCKRAGDSATVRSGTEPNLDDDTRA